VPTLFTPAQPFPEPLTAHDRRHARLANTRVGRGGATVMACQPPGTEGRGAHHQGQDGTEAFNHPDAWRQTFIISDANLSLHHRGRGAVPPVTHA